MQKALSETLVQKNRELLRDNIVKVIALFLAGWKRSWFIYAKLKGGFKGSATLKKDFNVIFFHVSKQMVYKGSKAIQHK